MAKDKILMVVSGTCADPREEEQFCRWYDEVHIPEVLKIPGFLGGTRYDAIDADDKSPHYVSIFELESEAAIKTFNDHIARQRRNEIPGFTPGPKVEVKMFKFFRKKASK